jgi:hypothetical protein
MIELSKNTQVPQCDKTTVISRFFRGLRVKRYQKLKASCKYFEVEYTDSLFGRFGGTFKSLNTHIVLARTHREAVRRLRKRGVSLGLCFNNGTTSEKWARYKIKEVGKPNNHRYIVFI